MNTFQIIAILLTGFTSASPLARRNDGNLSYNDASKSKNDPSKMNKSIKDSGYMLQKPELPNHSKEKKTFKPIGSTDLPPRDSPPRDVNEEPGYSVNTNPSETDKFKNGDEYSENAGSYKQDEQNDKVSPLNRLLLQAVKISMDNDLKNLNTGNEIPTYPPPKNDGGSGDISETDYFSDGQNDISHAVKKKDLKDTETLNPNVDTENYDSKISEKKVPEIQPIYQ